MFNIPEKLKKYRNALGLSQTEVAEKIEVTKPTYASYEKGKDISGCFEGFLLGCWIDSLKMGGGRFSGCLWLGLNPARCYRVDYFSAHQTWLSWWGFCA